MKSSILTHHMVGNPYDSQNKDSGYVSTFDVGMFSDTVTDFYTSDILSEFLFRHVMGCVLAETDNVRQDDNIMFNYVNHALSRLDNNEFSGLVPQELHSIWSDSDPKTLSRIRSITRSAAQEMSEFPDLSTLNTVDVNTRVLVDYSVDDVPALISGVVETKNGMAGIVPTIRGYDATLSSLSHLSYPHNAHIPVVHIWDIYNKKITRATPEEFHSVLNT